MGKPLFDPNQDWKEIFGEIDETPANPKNQGTKEGVHTKRTDVHFNMKPEELENYLKKFVIGQEQAIEVISTKVCTHFNRMKLEKGMSEEDKIVGGIKSNMLLIGPTGVGKTYIIKLIAKKLGVPFVKADATKFSETGYVGGDVEDLVRELVAEADGDIAKAEYGIIYLDEIDKIASSGSVIGPDVSRTGVQRNLLKLMEEAEVDLKTPHDLASQVEAAMEAQRTGKVSRKKINTRNILFIVSGAFGGLNKIIKRRMNYKAIGFNESQDRATIVDSTLLKSVATQDLIDFGFESEFIGRLPVTIVLNEIDEETMYKILKNPHSSVVNGKKLDFKSYGIDLEFADGALRLLAKAASKEKTGARGLLSVFEKVLIKYEKTLPSLDIKSLVVDENVVNDPEKSLAEMMLNDSIRGFQKDFLVNHGIYLDFEEEAVKLIQEKAVNSKRSFSSICGELFHDYSYAIQLMKLEKFTITVESVKSPSSYMEDYVRKNYKPQPPAPPEQPAAETVIAVNTPSGNNGSSAV